MQLEVTLPGKPSTARRQASAAAAAASHAQRHQAHTSRTRRTPRTPRTPRTARGRRCVELVRDLCRSGGCESGPGAGRGGPDWRIPLLVTGGGGYTPPLVARCWALETAVLLGRSLSEQMPAPVAEADDLKDLGPSYFK